MRLRILGSITHGKALIRDLLTDYSTFKCRACNKTAFSSRRLSFGFTGNSPAKGLLLTISSHDDGIVTEREDHDLKSIWRVTCTAIALGLTGCVIDISNEEDTYQPDRLPGEFYDSRVTRNFYPDARWATGRAGEECVQENAYFETRNGRVRVYGTTAYSETTFRVAATEIDNRIGKVLNYYGWGWRDFVYDRSTTAPYPRHILVCLSNVLSYNRFAEASLSGLSVAPYHRQWPDDAGSRLDKALHEFVQENMAGYVGHSSAPEWFVEGHSASASGWDSAESYRHYDHDPVIEDAPSIEHSILAYEYLEGANRVDSVRLLWMRLRGSGDIAGFSEVFDAAGLRDRGGEALTYERFARDYHDLMAQTY